MTAILLMALFSIAALMTAVSLIDSTLRGRNAFVTLRRECALARRGFVPMVDASEIRLRKPAGYRGAATRPFARQVPRLLDAA